MPTLKLTGGKPAASRTAPRSKPAATTRRTRPTAAKKAPAARKPAATAQADDNGNVRGPRLPEGMTKGEFNRLIKDMQKARANKEAAAEALAEAQQTVNEMALEMIDQGIQMSVVSTELVLSRQWMYSLMEKAGMTPAQSRKNKKPAAKKAAAKKPAARKSPARKAPAPARKRPAPAAKRGGGRVSFAR